MAKYRHRKTRYNPKYQLTLIQHHPDKEMPHEKYRGIARSREKILGRWKEGNQEDVIEAWFNRDQSIRHTLILSSLKDPKDLQDVTHLFETQFRTLNQFTSHLERHLANHSYYSKLWSRPKRSHMRGTGYSVEYVEELVVEDTLRQCLRKGAMESFIAMTRAPARQTLQDMHRRAQRAEGELRRLAERWPWHYRNGLFQRINQEPSEFPILKEIYANVR